MQISDKLKAQLGTWCHSLTPFIENSGEFEKIFGYLKEQTQVKKKLIIPKAPDLFKSLEYCDKSKLHAVIVLMDPYPTLKEVKGKEPIMIANGIPMDCSNTGAPQPSLEIWYDGMIDVYGFDPDMDKRADLSYLLKEEHVLLINSSLSVEHQKVGSHETLWRPFMVELFRILNDEHRGLPIVLCGTSAQKYEKEINPLLHYILKCEHPIAASYANRAWDHKNLFLWVNNIIKNNNGVAEQVQWYRKKVWQDNKSSYKLDKNGDLKSAEELGLPKEFDTPF